MELLPEDMYEGEENWFETIDEVVFTQKHKKMYNWMKEVENDEKSVKSSRSMACNGVRTPNKNTPKMVIP